MSLRNQNPEREIRVWSRREDACDRIRKFGFANLATTRLEKAVDGVGIIAFCTPVECMEPLARQIRAFINADATITDAGSVKAGVVRALEPIFGQRFVGAHPIAGSEKTGIDAASEILFNGATCVLTPTAETAADALAETRAFWSAVGCRIVEMGADAHDAALARTSHLPHLVAAALMSCVDRSVAGWPDLVGGGFRDTTRIAAGDPDLWEGILMANRAEVACSVAELEKILQNMRVMLESGQSQAIADVLSVAREARIRLISESDGT